MSNLVFSLNTTMPVFLMMVLGFFLHQVHIIDDGFASKLNKFVFSITLPVMLFHQLGSTNFVDAWDSRFVLFCFTVTAVTIALVWFLSFGIHSLPERGEFVQAAYRSSAAILGIAYMQNMYGDASMAPLMIIGSVPLYNIIAVVVLTLTAENELSNDRDRLFKKTVFSILKNPIILGIVFGLLWSLSGLRFPHILDKTLQDIGSVSTPLGLLAMGASVELNKVRGSMKNSLIAVFIKLFGCCMLFLPLAVWMGFRTDRDSHHAGVTNDGQLLYYGAKYGARRRTYFQFRNSRDGLQFIFSNFMDLAAEIHGLSLIWISCLQEVHLCCKSKISPKAMAM